MRTGGGMQAIFGPVTPQVLPGRSRGPRSDPRIERRLPVYYFAMLDRHDIVFLIGITLENSDSGSVAAGIGREATAAWRIDAEPSSAL